MSGWYYSFQRLLLPSSIHIDHALFSLYGAIVNCSSLGGLIGGARRETYHAAKRGVLGLAKSAALEFATRSIRVNAVCAGMIQTPMSDKMIAKGQGEESEKMTKTHVPMQRLVQPEEIADAVLWLCSSAASYVT